jgi:hypothetical protein
VNKTASDEILTHIFNFIFNKLQEYTKLNQEIIHEQVNKKPDANEWNFIEASE